MCSVLYTTTKHATRTTANAHVKRSHLEDNAMYVKMATTDFQHQPAPTAFLVRAISVEPILLAIR